ncbi:beta strand repeat-containing protein [Geminisphaera colitermitum]|uniref:beta strand repeat-containing protein n=1 Tax=Geminisphaera colitermitum TaxID=1148786 RepID=UPI000158D348|nr:autotransporter-associated beta strand repeat-containing protein [Geminisphaera colitermitum]
MKKTNLLVSIILPLAPALLFAQTAIWTGGGANNRWSTVGNWQGNTPPDSTRDAIFAPPAALTVNLNSENVTAKSLDITLTNNMTISGGGSLTLTSGNLTTKEGGGGSLTISSDVVLGASGEWNLTRNLTVNNAISDGGSGFGIKKTGTGYLYLYGASTYSGGFEMNGGSIYIYNNAAFGTGTFKVSGGSILSLNTDTIANRIELALTGSPDWRIGTAAGFGREVTISGAITDTATSNLRARSDGGTWRFTNSITIKGGLSFGSNATAASANTYILSSNPSLNSGAANISLGLADSFANYNLLFDTAGTYSNFTHIVVAANLARNTIGGSHTSGTVTIAPSGDIQANNSGAGGSTNFATLNKEATTQIGARITGAAPISINASWQQVDAAATAAANTTNAAILANYNPLGVVEFSRAAGNTYTGGTTVEAGTLRVSNTSGSATGTGAVLVNAGARLDGTGIIKPTGANGVSIANGATLAAGGSDAPGILRFDGSGTSGALLTLDAGASLEFRLGAPGSSDQIALWNYTAGDLVLSNNTVNITNTTGLTEGTYTLFSFYADSGINTSVVSGILNGLTIGTGLEAFTNSRIEYLDNRINLVVAASSAIPETATWLWIAIPGLLGIAIRRMVRPSKP